MPSQRFLSAFALPATLFLFLVVDAWAAPRYQVLHAFTGGKDGGGLFGPLLLDTTGDLYGTTIAGGPKGKGGTVFELTPGANGTWTQTVLHNFCSQTGCEDGGGPTGGVVFGSQGNLYGSTTGGGGSYTYGTIFEMKHDSGGWKFAVIHRFRRNDKANGPFGGVIMDGAGNLYGVGGCAFELSPEAGGQWKEHILHCYPAFNGDGWGILDRPILDASGNLYGTTDGGGGSKNCGGGCGTVFELSPGSDGKWQERILHRFQGLWDGTYPGVGALLLDSAGNLYGTADGGKSGHGVIFKLSRGADGHWKETVLYNLTGGANGDNLGTGVVMDTAGNLYGTTPAGGDPNCDCGVIYKLAPGPKGKWTYTVLHTFIGTDGAQPGANLILDDKGNLYGTTITGGSGGYGVAFELTP